MNLIQNECTTRRITRLCHFTQSRNLAHIFDDPYGLCSTRTLQECDMPHNPTDPERLDGRDDLVCCSVQYPNVFYFDRVRNKEPFFKDWVVLFIDPKYLWASETNFCPRNAAAGCGRYIAQGYQTFQSLFANSVNGAGDRIFNRQTTRLIGSPTDIQAEVLVKDPIPLESIIGIVVESNEQAQREICRFDLQGISIYKEKDIYVVPQFFNKSILPNMIQRGIRVKETLYSNGGYHDL